MTSEQIRNILKALPNGTTAYKEIKIYLKKGRLPLTYEATRLQMNLKKNDLLYLNRASQDDSLSPLNTIYTQFIDVNEIQSINFIQ